MKSVFTRFLPLLLVFVPFIMGACFSPYAEEGDEGKGTIFLNLGGEEGLSRAVTMGQVQYHIWLFNNSCYAEVPKSPF